MNVDKHDLFRNAVPGYIFFIVVLSFYAVPSGSDALESLGQAPTAFVLAVAGFPLGFIIHALYRTIFHHFLGESDYMDNQDAKLIKDKVNDPQWWAEFEAVLCQQEIENVKSLPINPLVGSINCIMPKFLILKQARRNAGRTFAHFLIRLVNREEAVDARIRFIFSYIHALGSSCLSILGALVIVCLVKFTDWNLRPLWSQYAWDWKSDQISSTVIFIIWIVTCISFYFARWKGMDSCIRTKQVFLASVGSKELKSRLLELIP